MHTNISHTHLTILAKQIELRELFTTYGIVSLALSFVSAFGPIYLFRSGYTLNEIITFFLLTAVIKVLILPVVFKLMRVTGSNRLMAFGIVFFVANFALFATISSMFWPLWLLAATKAAANACYYTSYRVNFALAHNKDKTGGQAATAQSLVLALSIVAPLVGGLISYLWSVSAVYLFAIGLFIIAGLVIWNAPQQTIRRISFQHIPTGSALKDYWSNFSYSFSGLSDLFVWPILISLIIPSYVGIGALSTLFALLGIITTVYIGKRIDDMTAKHRYLGFGVGISFIYGLGRIFASSTSHLIGLGFVSALGNSLTALSYEKRYYTNASTKQWLEYLFAQEIANGLPWIVYFFILLTASSYLSMSQLLYFGVIVTLPFTFGTLFIRKQS